MLGDFAFFFAFWLGVLTAISPCPLATNIAAISFMGRQTAQQKFVLFSGLFYAMGRVFAYMFLGFIILRGLLGSSEISRFLQEYMNQVLGPLLILLGLILLGWIDWSFSLSLNMEKVQEKAKKGGFLWSFLIGFLFALSFCPVSAGLFFGGLIPLGLKENASLFYAALYGIGTALPVMLFALLLAFSSSLVSKVFHCLSVINCLMRYFAGGACVFIGIYYTCIHIYGLSLFF